VTRGLITSIKTSLSVGSAMLLFYNADLHTSTTALEVGLRGSRCCPIIGRRWPTGRVVRRVGA
jgi:hypothetical protein